MSEFHDDYPQYEIMAQHSDAEGGPKRKALWKVFWIMLGITIVELIVGSKAEAWGLLTETRNSGLFLKLFFILFTIAKAYYIVYSFMHLGHEVKPLKWVIIAPYTVFILYLIYMASVAEGTYSKEGREAMNVHIVNQAKEMQNGGGHHESTGAGHDEHKSEEPAKHEEPKH